MKKEKCCWFVKIKVNFGNSGLCLYEDCRIDLDNCKKCDKYSGVKYKRKKPDEV